MPSKGLYIKKSRKLSHSEYCVIYVSFCVICSFDLAAAGQSYFCHGNVYMECSGNFSIGVLI